MSGCVMLISLSHLIQLKLVFKECFLSRYWPLNAVRNKHLGARISQMTRQNTDFF